MAKQNWWELEPQDEEHWGSKRQPSHKCYETHKPMLVGDHFIHGGSCIHPKVTDAHVYVGFDSGMRLSRKSLPWVPGQDLFIEIPDMGVPRNKADFDEALLFVADSLKAGLKVHCGCIGGHGRTGMFFAALVCQMTGEKDATTYVREHYCHKAVESAEQVNWLHKFYGVKKITGHKEHSHVMQAPDTVFHNQAKKPASKVTSPFPDKTTARHQFDLRSVWNAPKGLQLTAN